MSFANTKTPLKPKRKAKYQLPMRRGKHGAVEYYFTPELEELFRRKFGPTPNRKMMELFGISFSTLQRFKREFDLKKDMKVIRRKQAAQTKRICEKNGYYESLRGKAPSEATIAATKAYRATHAHPLQILKENDPAKYKRTMKKRSEKRKKKEHIVQVFLNWGIENPTNLHRPNNVFTHKQASFRYGMKQQGYILGDIREEFGERFTIFYDDETTRSAIRERHAVKQGFKILPLPTD